MFFIFILCVIVATACLPLIIGLLGRKRGSAYPQSYNWLPAAAALLFLASYFIPDIHISNETDTFQQHFVGGGLYAACLFIYFQRLLRWNDSFVTGFVQLFAWVSALGVANELFEFALTKLDIVYIDTHDTAWDLVANTCGALIGYSIFLCVRLAKKS